MTSSFSKKVEYGSFERSEPFVADEGSHFVDDSLFYLTARPDEHRRKCWKIITPVVVAVIIMGGFVYALARYFNTLYPTDRFQPYHGHDLGSNIDAVDESPSTKDAAKSQYRYPECSFYYKCANLEGLCCPTREGIYLDCCH